jgi:hypothetical protein
MTECYSQPCCSNLIEYFGKSLFGGVRLHRGLSRTKTPSIAIGGDILALNLTWHTAYPAILKGLMSSQ